MSIHVLKESVASKIAAGEVIERPASIIKELIENSIDAKCTAITIEVKQGGIPYIRISDNGSGMSYEDASICFERHATSKISSEKDIDSVTSLGFRGEALYSIAAVSQLELVTREKHAQSGTKVVIHGGVMQEISETGCPEGTTIIVRNVFYNTPARLKFLKRIGIEAGYIGNVVANMIMAHPSIAFRYINNGEFVYSTPGNGNLADCIYSIYGKDIYNYCEVLFQEEDIKIYGYVGKPEIARSNRGRQSVFVNGRYVRSLPISSAVLEAYDTRIMVNRFPPFVLHITMPPEEMDVNMHPNKVEVRFENERAVKDAVTRAVKDSLSRHKCQMQAIEPSKEENERKPHSPSSDIVSIGTAGTNEYTPKGLIFEPVKTDIFDSKLSQKAAFKEEHSLISDLSLYTRPQNIELQLSDEIEVNIIGQLFTTYILAQKGDKFYLIDQHAAHERILYEDFMQKAKDGDVISQPLLVPVVISLTPLEKETILSSMELFCEIGFDIEEFGPLSLTIRAVPYIMGAPQTEAFFRDYLDNLTTYASREALSIRRDRLITLSCKKAIKGGDKISNKEIFSLIKMLEQGNIPLTCPHGRPVIVSMGKRDIEKIFGR